MDKAEMNHLEDLIASFDDVVASLKDLNKQADENKNQNPIDNKEKTGNL